MNRRRLLGLALPAFGMTAVQTGCGPGRPAEPRRPRALVYRGPGACDGCAEAVAALLRSAPSRPRVRYCGPGGDVPLTASSLAEAEVYAQPGGGDDLAAAWREMRDAAGPLRRWVRGGGRYLGFCMGAYLAGRTPGFGLLPGDTDAYISSRGASVHTAADTVIPVRWRGQLRHMYFQDGPFFRLTRKAATSVIATYDNGLPAALLAPYGEGRVAVAGPHPEADSTWYADHDLANPDGVRFDLGHDLVESAMAGLGRKAA
ncbi:BPL-N domain-containing protein [Streptomyces sp. 6N223]|uniref:BPL-N domain-containing protein n=1 Tax=Streptomyces sp. 6N223 TaxID=3457412 RepID=UPI003FD6AD30